jgi:hypothetical protein
LVFLFCGWQLYGKSNLRQPQNKKTFVKADFNEKFKIRIISLKSAFTNSCHRPSAARPHSPNPTAARPTVCPPCFLPRYRLPLRSPRAAPPENKTNFNHKKKLVV